MRKLSLLLSVLVLWFSLACGSGGGSTPPPPPPPPAPVISAFSAAQGTIDAGGNTQLTATFSNGTATISGGVGAVTSGTAVTVTPAATTTYTLTVTNSASQSVSQAVTVTVVALPTKPVLTVPVNVTAGQGGYTASTPDQPGCTFTWALTNGTITAGADTHSITFTAGTAGTLGYRCTATNAAGTGSPLATASTTVVDAPLIASFGASPASIPQYEGTVLSAVYAGGSGVITPGNLALASGHTLNLAPNATTTYTLTVTNLAGGFTTAAATVTVTAPLALRIASLTATPATVAFGGSGTLDWAIVGSPTTLTLDGADVFGTTTAQVTPTRRQTYTLQAFDGSLTATKTIKVAAQGLDLLAGHIGSPSGGAQDGLGFAARFYGPMGLASDAVGNVYVADSNNHTIRKVSPAGLVSTLAGTAGVAGSVDDLGAAASFNNPVALVVGADGTVYVADGGNSTIRKITPAGLVSTLAGTAGVVGSVDALGAAASFNFNAAGVPAAGLALGADGTLYVADSGNATIRAITPAGLVSTLAGTAGAVGILDGTGAGASFISPSALALDGAGNLYVGDGYLLRKIAPGAVVSTLAGDPTGLLGFHADGSGAAAAFAQLSALVVDASGMLYAADSYDQSIRKITPTGDVSTMAGLVIVDAGNGSIHGATGSADGPGAAASFYGPMGLALDASGNLVVADSANNTLRKVSPAGQVSTWAGASGLPSMDDGLGLSASFDGPHGLAVDGAGNTYVADLSNLLLRKITPAGLVSTVMDATAGGPAAQGNLQGVAVDGAGNVYVSAFLSGAGHGTDQTIQKITPAGQVSILAGAGGQPGLVDGDGTVARFKAPYGLALDADGNLYVADSGNRCIRKITPAGLVSTLLGTSNTFLRPTGVAVDGAGTVYVADAGSHSLWKVSPAGLTTLLAGVAGTSGYADGPASSALFNAPTALVVDAAGNVYVTDTGNGAIRKITPAGAVSTMAGTGDGTVNYTAAGALPASIASPYGIALTSDGDLMVTTNNGVVQITAP